LPHCWARARVARATLKQLGLRPEMAKMHSNTLEIVLLISEVIIKEFL
jgi:hypothetical protein